MFDGICIGGTRKIWYNVSDTKIFGGSSISMKQYFDTIPANTSNAQIRILSPEKGYRLASGIFGANLEITRKGFFGGLCAQITEKETTQYSKHSRWIV